MAVTYTPTSATERDYIIRDTVENSGPLPEGANFSDDEIAMMLAVEGTWQRTVAACYEALHSAWADHVSWQGDGISVSMSHVPKNYEAKAKQQRKLFGATPGQASFTRSMTRVDGYSQDVASNVIDDVSY
jgi:hypothetical protein